MPAAYVLDAIRTPIGRYGGALAGTRPDDLAAHAVRALLARSPQLDPAAIDDVVFGDANGGSMKPPSSRSEAHDLGIRVRREVLGDEHVDRAVAGTTPLDAANTALRIAQAVLAEMGLGGPASP